LRKKHGKTSVRVAEHGKTSVRVAEEGQLARRRYIKHTIRIHGLIIIIIIIIIVVVIQPLGRFGQRPELSQATGMALVRCILGKFLRGSLPLLSSAFRPSPFRHQLPPRAPRRERS